MDNPMPTTLTETSTATTRIPAITDINGRSLGMGGSNTMPADEQAAIARRTSSVNPDVMARVHGWAPLAGAGGDDPIAALQRTDEVQEAYRLDHERRLKDLESLADELDRESHNQGHQFGDIEARLAVLEAAPTCPPTDIKADLYQRLTSRKFWAFIAGLVTLAITTWQTTPDPRYALGAVAVAVVGYVYSQSREDSAKAKAEGEKATATASVQVATATAQGQVQSSAIMRGQRPPG